MNIIGMSNVSFLTNNIQYTTLKLNFALRANDKKTAFPMIVILTAILKNKSRPLSLLKFSRQWHCRVAMYGWDNR